MPDTENLRIAESLEKLNGEVANLSANVGEVIRALSGDKYGTEGLVDNLKNLRRYMEAHEVDDNKRFAIITDTYRTNMESIRINLARWAGGLAALMFVIGLAVTVFFERK